MKRLTTLILSLFMLFSLTSCNRNLLDFNPSGSSGGGQADPSGSVEEGYVKGGDWGFIGDTMYTYWFNFTVNNAYLSQEYGGYTPAEGNQLVVVEMTLLNTSTFSTTMLQNDFQIQWGDGETDYGYPIAAVDSQQFPDEYDLSINETRTGLLVYEVPVTDSKDYSISFKEFFADDTEGDVYFIYFTATES